jgi:hypothetical protein
MRMAAFFATGALAAGPQVKPRDAATEYRLHSERDRVSVGAEVLSPGVVRSTFASDVERGWLVVEIGVFPKEEVEISRDEFRLVSSDGRSSLRAVEPRVIAARLQKAGSGGRDVTLYPSVGVGHATGPYGGTGTAVGVGVGVGGGGDRPASTDADRRTMELELSEKGLPEGRTSKPVAGHLYFPLPQNRNIAYTLEFKLGEEKFLLPVGKIAARSR